MKKWILAFSGLLLAWTAIAQQQNIPAYKRYPTIPPIELLQIDSTTLTKENLKKKQPVMIMYFSPTCEHCIHQMNDMIKKINDLKKVQIVMATYQPFSDMVEFYNKYQLSQYANIKIGRDTKYVLPPFYTMNSLPYFALYDKKGNLITTFEGNVKVDKLLHAFKH